MLSSHHGDKYLVKLRYYVILVLMLTVMLIYHQQLRYMHTLYVFRVINPKQFLAQCMEHIQQPVRTAAFDSLLRIYSHHGNVVRQKLSTLEEKKSSIVWRKLFESFDRIDGKPSAADIAVRDPSPYHKTHMITI